MDIDEELVQIFKVCQLSSDVHHKNGIRLESLYKSDPDNFWESLRKRIDVLLTTEPYSEFVEKIIKFLAQFCSTLKVIGIDFEEQEREHEDHVLLIKILRYLLQASENDTPDVRHRSLQITTKILEHLGDVEVSPELCEEFQNSLFPRLKDSPSGIRENAILCLHCFQNPAVEEKLTTELLNIMQTDCQPKVRKLAIEKIFLLNTDVLEGIISRIHDVDVEVKLAAYKRLSCIPKNMKIYQRRHIFQSVFADRSEEIKDALKYPLISNWLECYANNVLKFLKGLRLDADENDIEITSNLYEKTLDIIFRWKSFEEMKSYLILDENRLISQDNLDWESASFWRLFLEFLSGEFFETKLRAVQPELSHLCGFIKKMCDLVPEEITADDLLKRGFILKQLFAMTKLYDYSDVSKRHLLNNLVKHAIMKVTLTSDLTVMIITTLDYSIPNINERTYFVNEIISDILYPVNEALLLEKQRNKDYQIAKLKVKLVELKQTQTESIQNQDFIRAHELKDKIDEAQNELKSLLDESLHMEREEKKTDVQSISKCLDITIGVLISPHVTSLTPSLISIKNNFVQNLLMTDIDAIRIRVLKCFALLGHINKDVAVIAIQILTTPMFAYRRGEECDMQTLLLCIGAVVDLLRVYGPQLIAVCETNEDKLSESMDENHQKVFTGGLSLTDIAQELVQLMNDEEPVIQERAALGLCQLILNKRISSPSVTAHLVVKWCNPACDETTMIKQIIGNTLVDMMAIPQCHEQFEESVFIVLSTLFASPKNSPLSTVMPHDIGKFLCTLGRVSHRAQEIHYNLTSQFLYKMIKDQRNDINSVYSRVLTYVDIPQNSLMLNELMKQCDLICSNDTYPTFVITSVSRFKRILQYNLDRLKNVGNVPLH